MDGWRQGGMEMEGGKEGRKITVRESLFSMLLHMPTLILKYLVN